MSHGVISGAQPSDAAFVYIGDDPTASLGSARHHTESQKVFAVVTTLRVHSVSHSHSIAHCGHFTAGGL